MHPSFKLWLNTATDTWFTQNDLKINHKNNEIFGQAWDKVSLYSNDTVSVWLFKCLKAGRGVCIYWGVDLNHLSLISGTCIQTDDSPTLSHIHLLIPRWHIYPSCLIRHLYSFYHSTRSCVATPCYTTAAPHTGMMKYNNCKLER